MNKVALLWQTTAAFIWASGFSTLNAQLATGGAFSLERSVMNVSAQISNGGRFAVIGSVGEGFHPANGSGGQLKGPYKRISSGFLGLPIKTAPSISHELTMNEGNIELMIPADSFTQSYEPLIESDPFSYPIQGDPSLLPDATQKLVAMFGSSVATPLAIVEIRFLTEDGALCLSPMANAIHSSLTYTDHGDGGKIAIYRLDESNRTWLRVDSVQATSGLHMANFSFTQAGIIAIFQQGPTEVGAAYAYPVPWRPDFNNAAMYGTAHDGITFTALPTVGDIGIYNLSGELVRNIIIPPGSHQFQWDGKTGSGADVASGVYIWSVRSPEGDRKTGKLMIIR